MKKRIKKVKICFFADASSLHTFRWAKFFAENGHEITVISLKKPTFHHKNIRFFWIKKIISSPNLFSHLINIIPVVFQLIFLKRKIKADIFHALGSSNGWIAAISGFKPLIYTIADPGILEIPFKRGLPWYYKLLDRYAIEKSSLLVCDGENIRKAMMGLGASADKIKIVRYGIDTIRFKPVFAKELGREKLLKQLCLDRKIIIISVKPLREECGVDTLLKAASIILRRFPDVGFLIIGDGEEKNNLICLAEKLKIDRAICFAGWVEPNDLPEYYNAADIFVGTSLVETGLASTTAEAMACGLPVVVTDSGDNKLVISDGENGFIFPPGDSEELAKKLITLINNRELRKKFSLSNRQWVEKNNDYNKEMAKMEKIYQQWTS